MKTIRAKLRVNSVGVTTDGPNGPKLSEWVEMNAVYSSDPTSENYDYSQATPAADVEMLITNPGAFGFFKEGHEYLIEFTEAEAKTQSSPPATTD